MTGWFFGVGALLLLLAGAVALVRPTSLISLSTNLALLTGMRVLLIVYALGWAGLLVDAWRLADPPSLDQRRRLALAGCNGVLCLGLTGALLFGSHLVAVQRDFIAAVFDGQQVSGAADGRYNILLLGGDAGVGRVGIRPDSITVASIDAQTGRAVLFGLPRNLAEVPFPDGSVMRGEFPTGFDCDGCYLNGVNTWATDNAELFPHTKEPGIAATQQAVEEITGLSINYYALIDLKGFQDLVDAVGGVTIDITEPIPVGKVGDITDWIQPGKRHLNGYETLWYARSRATSDDYSRMARQKCVMNAMLRQLDPATVLSNFSAIAGAGEQIISTSIPASEVDVFVGLAGKAKSLPVSSVAFVPPKINTSEPDWSLIRTMVGAAIERGEAADSGDKPDTGTAKKRPGKKLNANGSTDLAKAC
ncbi:MAG: LCP family protein [Nocardioidaceae bacterium]|nr:LCP family protein [Nocardioidaceae bacterium]